MTATNTEHVTETNEHKITEPNTNEQIDKTEKMLVERFASTKQKLDAATKVKTDAENEFKLIKIELAEFLTQIGAKATRPYEGIGKVTMLEPTPRPSCKEEDKSKLFEFIKSIGREDAIKEAVHPSTLGSIVKERLEKDQEIPSFITYYLDPNLRLNK